MKAAVQYNERKRNTVRNEGTKMAQRVAKVFESKRNTRVSGPVTPNIGAVSKVIKEAVYKAHSAGLTTTHCDETGLYQIRPDGQRENVTYRSNR
jgi:hypothetical protein